MLPHVEQDVLSGAIFPDSYVLLFDRTQLMSGGEQRYGSQIEEGHDGTLRLSPIESLDRVDEFRAELGLEPLSDYLDSFGEPVALE